MQKIKTSKRLRNFDEYIFSKLNKVVKKVEADSGRKVLNLGQGNPDLKPSDIYIEKLCDLVKAPNAYTYPGYGAQKEFQDALINWYKKRFNVVLSEDELYPLLGAKDGVSHLPLALLDEGDEVLVPDPGYSSCGESVVMVGAKPVFYNLNKSVRSGESGRLRAIALATERENQWSDFKIDLTELEKKITRKTKFIWVNFPSNPTGQVINIDELKEIVDFCKKHNIIIVYDNAYSEIAFDGFVAPSILEIEGAREIAVELGSFSKTFSFAGFRMGWIVGNKDVVAALAKVKSQMDSGLATPIQQLGAFALDNLDQKWHNKMIQTYQKRRDVVAKHLKTLGLEFSIPRGGLYIWARIPENAKDSEQFCLDLLEKKQIFLAPGIAFGKNSQRFVRASICTNIDKIDEYFKVID